MCTTLLSLQPSELRSESAPPHTCRITRRVRFDPRHRCCALAMLIDRAIRTSVLILVMTVPAAGADYFVSPSGDDGNDGTTPEIPYSQVQTGLDQLAPSDTLYLMPGLTCCAFPQKAPCRASRIPARP